MTDAYPWRVEVLCTRYRNKSLYQTRLRDDHNRIVCFGFGKNPNAAYLRLSTHAQGTYHHEGTEGGRGKEWGVFPVIEPKELPLALLALERFKNKK